MTGGKLENCYLYSEIEILDFLNTVLSAFTNNTASEQLHFLASYLCVISSFLKEPVNAENYIYFWFIIKTIQYVHMPMLISIFYG